MRYQHQSDVPRKGITDQELRLRDLLTRLHIRHYVNQVYCFTCRNHFTNPSQHEYPGQCAICKTIFNDRGLYCMPDFIIEDFGKKGVLLVNGSVHEKNKQVKKDRFQVAELRHGGFKIFIINNSEIDNMTNATLMAYLTTVVAIIATDNQFYEVFYSQEKEYPCLR